MPMNINKRSPQGEIPSHLSINSPSPSVPRMDVTTMAPRRVIRATGTSVSLKRLICNLLQTAPIIHEPGKNDKTGWSKIGQKSLTKFLTCSNVVLMWVSIILYRQVTNPPCRTGGPLLVGRREARRSFFYPGYAMAGSQISRNFIGPTSPVVYRLRERISYPSMLKIGETFRPGDYLSPDFTIIIQHACDSRE